MRPSIEVGDIVIVAQKTSLLQVGDVISYRVKDSPYSYGSPADYYRGDGSYPGFLLPKGMTTTTWINRQT